MTKCAYPRRWYIVYSPHPLEAAARCEIWRRAYNLRTKSNFEFEVRTPSQYVGSEEGAAEMFSRESRDFLFRYVFIKAKLPELDAFLHWRDMGSIDMRLVQRRSDGERLMAATISEADIDRFFRFCAGYAIYSKNQSLPFFELTPDQARAGDYATVLEGPYAGTQVSVAPDQTGVDDEHLRVNLQMFSSLAVPLVLERSALSMQRPARYSGNKYALYDEFFDYYSLPAPRQRLLSGQSDEHDIAKANRMQRYIGPLQNPRLTPRPQRDSRRLRTIKLGALTICSRILGNVAAERQYGHEWEVLVAKGGDQASENEVNKLIHDIIQSCD